MGGAGDGVGRYVPLGVLVLIAAVTVTITLALGTVMVMRGCSRHRAIRAAAATLLLGNLAVLFVLSIYQRQPERGINLVPLRSITRELHNVNTQIGLANVFGNILVFMPIGFLTPVVLKSRARVGVLAAAAMSLLVEVVQYATASGISDIDDITTNVLGALIGALILMLTRSYDHSHGGGLGVAVVSSKAAPHYSNSKHL